MTCLPRHAGRAALVAGCLAASGCGEVKQSWDRLRGAEERLELPALLTTELPFRYPPNLFTQQVPGDVTLRLYIDSLGLVVPESIQVAEPAAHPGFDSAAVEGASRLVFRPARRGERRVGYMVLFPIKFRVPSNNPPPSGDTTRTRP
jgi:TonB family protein